VHWLLIIFIDITLIVFITLFAQTFVNDTKVSMTASINNWDQPLPCSDHVSNCACYGRKSPLSSARLL